MITKEIIETIKNRISIVDIVSLYVELKKRGQSYMACCPFHNENTPSFSVSPRNNIFKCFGCGESGDAIKFVEKIENVDFLEAIKIIAKHYDINIVEEESALTDEQIKIKNAKEINKAAQNFFFDNLQHSNIAQSYLRERKISDDTIKKFFIGYADQNNKWKLFSEQRNFSTQLQIQLGLLINKDSNVYDRFNKRIIFPICNSYGEVLGFAGRIFSEENQNQAKYINSQDSFLYHKSSILYGLHLAKQTIKEKEKCYLVEGYFDVIMMHQKQILNTVSSSGTSLTDGQCQILKKFTNTVVIMYDGDEPGIKSTNKAIEKLLIHGLKVSVVILPNNDDPDSFIKKNFDVDVQKVFDELEIDFLTFKINSLKDKNVNERTESIRELINLISSVPDDIYKAILFQKVKEHLGVQNEYLQIPSSKEKKFLQRVEKKNSGAIELLEREIIRLLLLYFNLEKEGVQLGQYILEETSDVNFHNEDCKKIMDIIKSLHSVTFNEVFNSADDRLRSVLIDIVAVRYEISDAWNEKYSKEFYDEEISLKDVRRTILSLKQKIIHEMITEKKKFLEKINDDKTVNDILNELKMLKQYEVMIFNEIQRN